MKRFVKILLAVVLLLIGGGGYLYYDASHNAPSRITTRFETISSTKIPEDFDDVQILFFSDILYNRFMDSERLTKIIDAINAVNPDIVIFLGDLFDDPSVNTPSTASQEELAALLKQIKAPLGKFAVYGDNDLASEAVKEICDDVLAEADFELLDDTYIRLYDRSSAYINLVALTYPADDSNDSTAVFTDVDQSTFTLTISHAPDLVEAIPNDYVDLMLSGHSLGGQVYLPLIGGLIRLDYAQKYYRGQHLVNNTLLDITNGIGTTRYDVRLFSDPEIVVYLFKHQ